MRNIDMSTILTNEKLILFNIGVDARNVLNIAATEIGRVAIAKVNQGEFPVTASHYTLPQSEVNE